MQVCIASLACKTALVDAVTAAPARQSLRDATRDCCSMPARERGAVAASLRDAAAHRSSSQARIHTAKWADRRVKDVAKDVVGAVDLAVRAGVLKQWSYSSLTVLPAGGRDGRGRGRGTGRGRGQSSVS